MQSKQPSAHAQGSKSYSSGEAVAATTAETQVALTFRQTTSILSWLHQNLLNEVLILESSALDSFKYAEVLNTVFGDRLPKRVSYRVQAQIEQIQDIRNLKGAVNQNSKENLWIYQFQMWNLLVQYQLLFMDQIFNKFNLDAKAFEKNLEVLQFMSPSRLKQLEQLSETLVQQTIPRLNQYLQSSHSTSAPSSFDQSTTPLSHAANPFQLHLERLSLLLLDMLKQLMRYASHKISGHNADHKVLYDKEVTLIGQRIIFYMIQGVKISKQEIEAQLTRSDVFSM